MISYLKSLVLSLIIFAVLYLGLTSIVSRNVGTAPSTTTVGYINVLAYLCWVISAYVFATLIKKYGFLNGAVFGICTLLIILPVNMRLISNEAIDLFSFLITFTGIGLAFGIVGGGIYDIHQIIKHKYL